MSAPTQDSINEELEKQHFLDQIKQLVLQEKSEVKKLKRKHMDIFLNVFLDLLEFEDNALTKIDTIASAVKKDNITAEQSGPSYNSVTSKSKFSNLLSYINIFSGFSSSKGEHDNDNGENENEESESASDAAAEDNKVTRDLIPVFIMCGLMVREQKKQTAEFQKISEKLDQIVIIQKEMAKHMEDSNILVKNQNNISKKLVDIELEKLEILKKSANNNKPST